ncbi:MAG: phosphoethanolamine transferase [Muribaculaceae bacterium]|nr:phosphoethanolamine transferase [Muribaculaceae bacterium]
MTQVLNKVLGWLKTAREWLLWPLKRQPVFFVILMLLFAIGPLMQVGHNALIANDIAFWKGAKSLAVVTFVVYVLTLLVAWVKQLKPVVYILALLLKFVTIFVKYNFMAEFNPVMLQALTETDAAETSEFLSIYAFSGGTIRAYIYIAVAVALILAGERWMPRFKRWFNYGWQRTLMALALVVLLPYGVMQVTKQAMLFGPSVTVDEAYAYQKYGPTDALSNIVYAVLAVNHVGKEAEREYEVTERAMHATSVCEETDSLHLIVVIGESYIKPHASVYGYQLLTTPRLQAELDSGHLFLFHDVIAPFNTTSDALKRTFSTNSDACQEHWFDYPFFPSLFKKAGYYVTYWDNQWDARKVDIFDFSLGSIVHNKRMVPYSYDLENSKRFDFDHELLDSYLHEAHGKVMDHRLSLSLFHLMGQHMYAGSRYPKTQQFMRFTPDSIKRTEPWLDQEKKQDIAHYDNATYYNDYVIGKLLDSMRNSCVVMVYFSDHGEEMFDWRDFSGRDEGARKPAPAMKLQYCVPFMVWCSDAFIARYPECVARLKEAARRKGVLDDLPHLLMDLGRVRNSYYKPEHDLISPDYKPTKRLVQMSVDYDEVVK